MCGIAGRFQADGLPPAAEWHVRADALLAHRGPDGRGRFADDCCELVHRRLALVDLSETGAQPITNEDGTVQVVCNGEIYNHRSLRAELIRRGHTMRGTSDTEIVAHLYEEHGERFVERLRGMFALAVYDRARRRVLLARDRFGVKPLYIATHRGQLAFASEIKALLALEGFEPRVDRQACYDFLGLGYVPEPATAFANVRALPKGTTLIADAAGQSASQYFKIAVRPARDERTGRDLETRAAEVEAALLGAVERQSVADVPVAALLSGGIDSSLVVAAHARSVGGGLETFNVRFPDAGYDETPMAAAVSQHYGTSHRTIDAEGALSPEVVFRLFRHFDQPFADTSLVPVYVVAKSIREHGIICALSGDGGDEAFGGYGRFWRANQFTRLMKLPGWFSAAAAGAGERLTGVTRDLGRQLGKAARLARAGREDSSVLIAGLSNYLGEEQKRELVREEARDGLDAVYRCFDGFRPPGVTDLEELSRRMTENLFNVSLPSDMLRKVDMMSMLCGVELRVPLLDEELVEIGMRLPHALKTDGHEGKLVLRAVARRWLPPRVAAHPKHGFGIPLDRMLSPQFHAALRDVLLSQGSRVRGFLDTNLIEFWLNQLARARDGNATTAAISREGLYQRVFIVLALELWLREHNLSW
ncbi:MAG: asparagine synthase (glutamine-hydrolyzing) [Pyrinomonadaceae bacterium]